MFTHTDISPQEGTFGWACQTLCRDEAEVNIKRNQAMTLILKTCERYLLRIGQGQDVAQDTGVNFVMHLLRQRDVRLNRLTARAEQWAATTPEGRQHSEWQVCFEHTGDEVYRWGRCGLDWLEVAGVFASFNVSPTPFLQRWSAGRVQAANGYWENWTRGKKLKWLVADNAALAHYVCLDELDEHITAGRPPARGLGGKRVHRTPIDEVAECGALHSLEQEYQLEMVAGERFETALAALKTSGWIQDYLSRCVEREPFNGWKNCMRLYQACLTHQLVKGTNGLPSAQVRNGRQMLWQRLFESVESACLTDAPEALRTLTMQTRARLHLEATKVQAARLQLTKEKGPNWSKKKKNLGEQFKTLKWKIMREEWGQALTTYTEIRDWCTGLDTELKKQSMLCMVIRETMAWCPPLTYRHCGR